MSELNLTMEADFPEELYQRLLKETELKEEIKKKFSDVCLYMYMNDLTMLQAEWPTGNKFTLTRE